MLVKLKLVSVFLLFKFNDWFWLFWLTDLTELSITVGPVVAPANSNLGVKSVLFGVNILNNSLNLNVKVSDGLADATADVVINITDVDENTITGLENSILQVENVFPIPAKKKLKVIIKDNVEIKKLEFIDFSGITTAPKNIKRKDNQLIMDVTNLSSGIYILNIVSENKSKKIRIVISR